MYNSDELLIKSGNAINVQLMELLKQYSMGHYESIVDNLVLLLNKLVQEANDNNRNYNINDDIALCAVCIIDSLYRLGAYRECLDSIRQYKEYKYYPDNAVLPKLLRGWCYLVLSQYGQAEEVAKQHLQSGEYSNNPEVDAAFLFLIGKARFMLKKFHDAQQHYLDSLALFRYAGNVNHSCVVLCALGLVEKSVGRLTKSIEYYDKAYELVDHNIYRDRAADIRLNKAIALLKIGNSAAAHSAIMENFTAVILPPLVVAKSKIVKARAHLSDHQTADAKMVAHGALTIFSSGLYIREEVVCLETCGDIEFYSNNLDEARLYYKRAEQLAKSIDNSTELIGGVLLRMALLSNREHDYITGLELAKQSAVLLGSVSIYYELGIAHRVISESYLGTCNYSASFKHIIKSISILQAHESMRELANSHYTAASICEEWYNYYQKSVLVDGALASLVVESYNMIAFDNRTLYEAAWNHALEAHSLFSMYGHPEDVQRITELFDRIKKLERTEEKSFRIHGEWTSHDGSTLVAYSQSMRSILSIIDIAANTDEPVLITGETGTGKELVAKLIHEHGPRSESPFVPVNCAAIPEQLFEREFFGNVKGAYTGADTSVHGLSDQANGGTLFLDEIGEMPLILQVKLLRLLQDGSYHRLGDPTLRNTNIRVIAATNADINKAVLESRFRSDLFYRLKTLEICVPPLRERKEDIEPLVSLFISKVLGDRYSPNELFCDDMLDIYRSYPWPGNVRELESITRRMALYAYNHSKITRDMLPESMQIYSKAKNLSSGSLQLAAYIENAERERIIQSLISSGGSRTIAALNLGISRKSLYAKMKRMKIEFPA